MRFPCSGLALAVALLPGCGRLGYESSPTGAPVVRPDASFVRDASNDATEPAESAVGAGGAASIDAGAGGRGSGGAGGASSGGMGGMDGGRSPKDAASDAPACSAPPSVVTDYCAALPLLPAPPSIDGVLDCGVSLQVLAPVAWTGGATAPDATAEYAVAWRPNGVYFFVHVHDSSLVPAEPAQQTWEGDSVEIYVDDDGKYASPPNYDNPGSRQLVVAAPPSAASSLARAQVWAFGNGNTFADWLSPNFRAYGTTDGYVVEALVTAADFGLSSLTLAAGKAVGMDLSIGVSYPTARGPDAGTPGNRVGQYFLHIGSLDGGATVIPPFDARAFCRPMLVP